MLNFKLLMILFIAGTILAIYQFQNQIEFPNRSESTIELEQRTSEIKQDLPKQSTRENYQTRIQNIQALLNEAKEQIAQLNYPEGITGLMTPDELKNELNLTEKLFRNSQEQAIYQTEFDNNYQKIEQEQIELMKTLRAQALAYQEKQKRLNLEHQRQIRQTLEQERIAIQMSGQQTKPQKKLCEKNIQEKINNKNNFKDPITGMDFIRVKAGTFMMGSPLNEADRFFNEVPHEVKLTKDFYLGKYEVTQREWQMIMGKNPSYFKNCGGNCPVDSVSWNKVQEFIRRLNERAKKRGERGGYRLPTEAEWEYAARAGTNTPFSFGENITTTQVNYNGNEPYNGSKVGDSNVKTIAACSLQANAWGFYEMHGNVWEWVSDIYDDYPERSVTDPNVQSGGSRRVNRGGSWDDDAGYCRSAFRGRLKPNSSDNDLGFRLARNSY
ncbi:MAG: SUMF1/EgtB/PvdO family nonheme iron enzyme [Gammaproteobacteria bacterium]|nr:SUMF1/EgtB/PvdO family nonheme iron enzyme [Gammaproteobacteria bacterium]